MDVHARFSVHGSLEGIERLVIHRQGTEPKHDAFGLVRDILPALEDLDSRLLRRRKKGSCSDDSWPATDRVEGAK